MEVQHGSQSVGDLRIRTAKIEETDDFSSPSKNFSFVSSPSSDSDSSTEDFEPDATKTTTTDITGTLNKNTGLASEHDERDAPNTSSLRQEQSVSGSASLPPIPSNRPELSSDNGSTSQFPATQTVQQNDSYRIPASAFARNKSTAPMEWSVASNESLFSIHGNMSFSRDQSFLWGRPEELGTVDEPTAEGLSFKYRTDEIPAADEKSDKLEEGSGVTEAADGTKNEVLKENAEDNSKEKRASVDGPLNNLRLSQLSDGSRSSVQSFAFPILASEGGRSGSLNMAAPEEQIQQGEQQHQQQQQQKQQEPESQSERKTSGAAPEPEPARTSWLACFPCCRPSPACDTT